MEHRSPYESKIGADHSQKPTLIRDHPGGCRWLRLLGEMNQRRILVPVGNRLVGRNGVGLVDGGPVVKRPCEGTRRRGDIEAEQPSKP